MVEICLFFFFGNMSFYIFLVCFLLLLLLSRFSRVRLCVTPQTSAHQAPPSLGFSRQEHWRGCHFLLQCMIAKSESEVAQSCLTLSDPMDQPGCCGCRCFFTWLRRPWEFPVNSTGVGCHCLLHLVCLNKFIIRCLAKVIKKI